MRYVDGLLVWKLAAYIELFECTNREPITENQAISVDKLFDFVLDGFDSEGCVIVNQFGHQFNTTNTVQSFNLRKFA